MNIFLTLKLVMVHLTMITYLKAVMYPAQINMGKMIPYLFNPVLMMNPPTSPLQAIPRYFQRKGQSLCLLKPQQPEKVLFAPRKIIAMFAKKCNLK